MKRLLIALLGVVPLMVSAQLEDNVISADRPGMATGTGIMPKGKVQWEVGMSYDRLDAEGEALKHGTASWNADLGVSWLASNRV